MWNCPFTFRSISYIKTTRSHFAVLRQNNRKHGCYHKAPRRAIKLVPTVVDVVYSWYCHSTLYHHHQPQQQQQHIHNSNIVHRIHNRYAPSAKFDRELVTERAVHKYHERIPTHRTAQYHNVCSILTMLFGILCRLFYTGWTKKMTPLLTTSIKCQLNCKTSDIYTVSNFVLIA